MKINELAQPRRAESAGAVFESYFGNRISISEMTHRQARTMLGKVRDLLSEERTKRSFHESEQNPAYLKLVMLENILRQRLNEEDTVGIGGAGVAATPDQKKAAQDQANKMKQAQLQQINKVKDPNVKNALTSAVQGKSMSPDQQQALANAAMASGAVNEDELNELSKDTLKSYAKKAAPDQLRHGQNFVGKSLGPLDRAHGNKHPQTGETPIEWDARKMSNRGKGISRAIDRLANESVRHSLRRALTEAELQQAQVVLAAQDLSDRLQKMLEEASTMQVKDLAALTDEIKSEVGVPQSQQYNQQVGAILATLVQALQTAKSGVDAAMGIVTGQEMAVPGETPPGEMPPPAPEMGGEMPPPEMGAEAPPAPEMPPEEPGAEIPGALGRERR